MTSEQEKEYGADMQDIKAAELAVARKGVLEREMRCEEIAWRKRMDRLGRAIEICNLEIKRVK